MPTRLQQNEYLFQVCKDVFTQGLAKARPVGPERAAAFAAGYAFGKLSRLRDILAQGLLDPDLIEAFDLGYRTTESSFSPPRWAISGNSEDAELVVTKQDSVVSVN